MRKLMTFAQAWKALPVCLVASGDVDSAKTLYDLKHIAQTELDLYESNEDGCISDSEANEVRSYLARLR